MGNFKKCIEALIMSMGLTLLITWYPLNHFLDIIFKNWKASKLLGPITQFFQWTHMMFCQICFFERWFYPVHMVPGTFCGPLTAKFRQTFDKKFLAKKNHNSNNFLGAIQIPYTDYIHPKCAPGFLWLLDVRWIFLRGSPGGISLPGFVFYHLELHTAYPKFSEPRVLVTFCSNPFCMPQKGHLLEFWLKSIWPGLSLVSVTIHDILPFHFFLVSWVLPPHFFRL